MPRSASRSPVGTAPTLQRCSAAPTSPCTPRNAQTVPLAYFTPASKRRTPLVSAAPPTSAIVSVILGEPGRAVRAAQECLAYGVHVGCFRPPSVPAGTSRLRLTARATLSDADIARAFAVLDAVLGAEPAAGGDAVQVARDAALQTRDTVRAAR